MEGGLLGAGGVVSQPKGRPSVKRYLVYPQVQRVLQLRTRMKQW